MVTHDASRSTAFAPPCPACSELLHGIGESGKGACDACATVLEFVLFPARNRSKPVVRAVRSLDGDATCFFHPQNQAAAVCDGCGRYVCPVCEITAEDSRRRCPPCIAAGRKKVIQKADEIVVYDSMASTLAFLPILMWPLTIVTAPTALFLAIYGWKKPRSLVRPGPARFVVAIVLAVLQIGGWITVALMLWLAADKT